MKICVNLVIVIIMATTTTTYVAWKVLGWAAYETYFRLLASNGISCKKN
jgi:hypothetical protein